MVSNQVRPCKSCEATGAMKPQTLGAGHLWVLMFQCSFLAGTTIINGSLFSSFLLFLVLFFLVFSLVELNRTALLVRELTQGRRQRYVNKNVTPKYTLALPQVFRDYSVFFLP